MATPAARTPPSTTRNGVQMTIPDGVIPPPRLAPSPPHYVARLAVELAVGCVAEHRPTPAWSERSSVSMRLAAAEVAGRLPDNLWARHADDDEPIYRIAQVAVEVLAAGIPTDVSTAHANVPGILWTTHPPHRFLLVKDTYTDRRWWADRFRELPYLDNAVPAPRPEGTLTLYRGAPPERRDGLTWTPDLGLAARYGPIWTVTVPAEAILKTYIDLHTKQPARVLAPEYLTDIVPAGAIAAPYEEAQAAWVRDQARQATP